MKKLLKTCCCPSALILRLVTGVVMFAHGSQKMLGWFDGGGIEGTLGFLGGLGVPTFIGYLIIVGEFFGGLMLILGLLTRVAAIAIAVIMAGAIALVHWEVGLLGAGAMELPLMIMGACVSLAITGGGLWSVDCMLAGECKTKEKK